MVCRNGGLEVGGDDYHIMMYIFLSSVEEDLVFTIYFR